MCPHEAVTKVSPHAASATPARPWPSIHAAHERRTGCGVCPASADGAREIHRVSHVGEGLLAAPVHGERARVHRELRRPRPASGRPSGGRGVEEDGGGDEFGVCGGAGAGDGPAEGPAANQRARVRYRALSQRERTGRQRGGCWRCPCPRGARASAHRGGYPRAGNTRVQCRRHRGVDRASARARVRAAHRRGTHAGGRETPRA